MNKKKKKDDIAKLKKEIGKNFLSSAFMVVMLLGVMIVIGVVAVSKFCSLEKEVNDQSTRIYDLKIALNREVKKREALERKLNTHASNFRLK